MNEQDIIQLEDRVRQLSEWKDSRVKERLVYPVDSRSKTTLNYWETKGFNGIPVATGNVYSFGDSLVSDFLAAGVEVSINNQKRALLVTFPLRQFTVNAATDVITNVNGAHNLNNGDLIAMNSTNLLPSGLSTIPFYVVNRTGTTFKVSLTLGGPAVNITDAGTGTQYYAQI